MKTLLVTSRAAMLAAAFFISAAWSSAQETPVAPPPSVPAEGATPAPAPTPTPTPLPLLMEGPGLDTMRALAAALHTEAEHAFQGTLAAANAGRPTRMFAPGIRMFSNRTEWLKQSLDTYRTKPFDVVGTVDMMHMRVGMLSRRMRRNPGLEHTQEDWDNIVDILDRMQKLLAGQAVTVPPPHTPRPAPTPLAAGVPPMLRPNPSPVATPVPAATPSPTPTPSPK